MAVTKIHPIKSTLKQALAYVLEGKKTNEGILVSSYACSPETADIEFSFTLSHCMQKGNNLAFHLIQSFKPGEIDPETAHKIGGELAVDLLKGNYEYVLCTHVDKGHIHNHIVFCAANFNDYRKFVSNRKSYHHIRKISDRLCEVNGLSIIDPIRDRGKSYKEYITDLDGTSWKSHIRRSIDLAITRSLTYEEYLIKLNILGIEVKDGKELAFRKAGDQRFSRAQNLGYRYSKSPIEQRIIANSCNEDPSRNQTRYRRIPFAFRELKLTERALNFIVDQGIDSYKAFETKQKELKLSLQTVQGELRILERRIQDISLITKQLRVIESFDKPQTKAEKTSRAELELTKIASEFLRDKGFKEPFPHSSSFAMEIVDLREQLEVLYGRYRRIRQDYKGIQKARRQIDQVLQKNPPQEL